MAAPTAGASDVLQQAMRDILTSDPQSTDGPPPPHFRSSSEGAPSSPPARGRSSRYYFQDSLVVLCVEGELMKVHRHHFIRESAVFRDMFSTPQGDKVPEGDTDQEPIELLGITKAEMEILLDYFYEGPRFEQYLFDLSTRMLSEARSEPAILSASGAAGTGSPTPAASSTEPSPNDIRMEQIKNLLNLFSIANRYDCPQVRQYAIRSIEKLRVEAGSESGFDKAWTAVDRIVIADRFSVSEWLVPAYEELCHRASFLTLEEAERIGPRRTAIIGSVREKLRYPYADETWVPDMEDVKTTLQSTIPTVQ